MRDVFRYFMPDKEANLAEQAKENWTDERLTKPKRQPRSKKNNELLLQTLRGE
jgi:hypothetical protein